MVVVNLQLEKDFYTVKLPFMDMLTGYVTKCYKIYFL